MTQETMAADERKPWQQMTHAATATDDMQETMATGDTGRKWQQVTQRKPWQQMTRKKPWQQLIQRKPWQQATHKKPQ